MRIWGLFAFVLNIYSINAQNLIVNPGAELDPLTNGWLEGVVALPTNSFHWTQSNAFFGEATPHGGLYHFYANDNSNGNYYLYQDVDVSSYAIHIDAGTCPFTFSFWTRMYNFSSFTPNDAARAYVEYRDAGGTVLSTYDSGWRTYLVWTQVSDTRTAPTGTRTIRIRLQSGFTSGSGADGYFDDLSLTTPVTLPVSIINFEAIALDNFINIRWQTSEEKNNAHFTIQRSSDCEHWTTIHQVKGSLESHTLLSYSFPDYNPFTEINYYRLIQTDIDSSKTNSEVISCLFENPEYGIFIYPNPCPVDKKLHINAPENSTLTIYSTIGDLIYLGDLKSYDELKLPRGVYHFLISDARTRYSTKIVIE